MRRRRLSDNVAALRASRALLAQDYKRLADLQDVPALTRPGLARARQATANARQRRRLLVLGLGAGALLLAGGLAWHYRAARRAVSRLIAEQAVRLALLLREVHHRVKNNLATVAGLLQLQASRLADPAARAVRESQRRVEALRLLHQALYQADDVTSVDLRRYVLDLFEALPRLTSCPPSSST